MACWVSLPPRGSLSSLPSTQSSLSSPLALRGELALPPPQLIGGLRKPSEHVTFSILSSVLRPFPSEECCTNSTGQEGPSIGLHLAPSLGLSHPCLCMPGAEGTGVSYRQSPCLSSPTLGPGVSRVCVTLLTSVQGTSEKTVSNREAGRGGTALKGMVGSK